MQAPSKRSRFRLLIALAAITVPLVGANAAHAAMAGANPSTTTLLPDLRSAQITGFDANTGATTVQVCFDKQIASVPTANSFRLGNYRASELPGDSASRDANGTCANVVYSTSFADPQQRPYVHVLAGAVANAANGFGNLADSVALNGANSHNGTRGHGVYPDLEGITINQATLKVNYIMDEPVSSASAAAGCFSVLLQNGTVNPNPGGGVTTSGNVISVQYAPGQLGTPGIPVVQGTVRTFGCAREATNGFSATSFQSATAPGTGGLSNNPDLISVTVDASTNPATADFTFDENIAATGGSIPAGSFRVVGADGLVGCSNAAALTAADIVNGNTVRVPLNAVATNSVLCNSASQNEYFVWGDVAPGVVTGTSAPAARTNPEAGIPTGGNAGAFANGFTTGPEAFSTAFNTSTGVVSVTLDQRFASFVNGQIRLVDDAGALIPGNPTSVAGAGGAAGPVVAAAQFTPGQVAGARSLALFGGAFTSTGGYPNVDQVLAPSSGTPKRQHRHGHVVRHKAHGKRIHRHGNNKRA